MAWRRLRLRPRSSEATRAPRELRPVPEGPAARKSVAAHAMARALRPVAELNRGAMDPGPNAAPRWHCGTRPRVDLAPPATFRNDELPPAPPLPRHVDGPALLGPRLFECHCAL